MIKTGSQILVDALIREGVEYLFGIPGGVVLPLFDVLFESPIKFILTRHEQGAGHAADGYARATGKVGVCLATSGPGATNLVTGIATAFMDSIPIVAITGQVRTSVIGNDAFQEVDTMGITRPITKHSYLVKDPREVARVVREAFYIARTGPPSAAIGCGRRLRSTARWSARPPRSSRRASAPSSTWGRACSIPGPPSSWPSWPTRRASRGPPV